MTQQIYAGYSPQLIGTTHYSQEHMDLLQNHHNIGIKGNLREY